MNKEKKSYKATLVILAALFLFLTVISGASALFLSYGHDRTTLTAFDKASSTAPIVQMCQNYMEFVLDGEGATDAPVIHYGDGKRVSSYISTHTKGSGSEACWEKAGTDIRKRCHCVGRDLHIITDSVAHDELVPNHLEKAWMHNILGHMTVEADFDAKSKKLLSESNPTMVSDIEYYASIKCNTMFEQEGGSKDLMDLLEESSGVDVRNDANIFCNGFKNQGMYDTVYGKKLDIPTQYEVIIYGAFFFFLAGAVFFLWKGSGVWRWVLFLEWSLFAIIGFVVLFAFVTNNSWAVTEAAVAFPAKLGILAVPEQEVTYTLEKIVDLKVAYLESGRLLFEDASGLSYIDSAGVPHVGALTEASKRFSYGILPLFLILFIVGNLWMAWKAFKN